MSWYISSQRSGEGKRWVGKDRLGIDSLHPNLYISIQLFRGKNYYGSIEKGGRGNAQLRISVPEV